MYSNVPTWTVCLSQDALEALGREDAACLQEQLKSFLRSRFKPNLKVMCANLCCVWSCQDALEALGEEDAACLQEQLKGGAPAKLTAAEGQVFEVTPAMVDISRVQKKLAGRCGAAQGPK